MLRRLPPEELARAEDRLRYPARGSRIEAAVDYGIDVTLLIEQLRLTPAERARRLEKTTDGLEELRGAARRRS